MICCIGHICATSLHCEFGDESSNFQHCLMICCNCSHLCNFSPVWVSKWVLRSSTRLNDLLHCTHLWGFSPPWDIVCLFRSPTWLKTVLYCAHLWDFTPAWVSRWLFSYSQLDWKNSCNVHICEASLQCGSASASSDLQLGWKLCCIVHTCVASPQCESAYAWQVCWQTKITWHTCCKDVCWSWSKSFTTVHLNALWVRLNVKWEIGKCLPRPSF